MPCKKSLPCLAILALCTMLLLSSCMADNYPGQIYRQAIVKWENGEYATAARQLLTLAELHPYSPWSKKARFFSASLYHAYLEEPEIAIQLYRQFLLWHPSGEWAPEVKYQLVSLYRKDRNHYDKSLYLLQDLIASSPPEKQILLSIEMAQISIEAGNLIDARVTLKNLLKRKLTPELTAHVYYLSSYTYLLENELELAKALFKKTASRFPRHPFGIQAAFNAADILEMIGEKRGALNAFIQLRNRHPNKKLIQSRIDALSKQRSRKSRKL